MFQAYALLHILSEDLECKVTLADEAYNLYKNIELAPQDEVSAISIFQKDINDTQYIILHINHRK